MHTIGGELTYTWGSAIGAILGYLLHITMSWGEWKKLSEHQSLTFNKFLFGDLPSFWSALLTNIILYFSLPQLTQLSSVVALVGFEPKMNFFSAAILAIASNAVSIKLRNIGRKLSDDGSPKD